MIALARDIPLFRQTIEAFVTGKPDALLLVELAEEDTSRHPAKLRELEELMAIWGSRGKAQARIGAVSRPCQTQRCKRGSRICAALASTS